jgi:crotonobetainyl-CoA:carnitine CoA-transferase CaiB-like acyl-CoA transferase
MNYLISGNVPGRMGTAHPNLVPYQAFATSDGDLILAVGNDRQFSACVKIMGLPDLATDASYASNASRIANRAQLIDMLQEQLRRKTTAFWLEAFAAGGVPAGPINDIGEVLGNDHAQERELVRELLNGAGDNVPTVSNPVAFDETPVQYDRAPPLLGEHTEEVLRDWLGYSADMIAELRSEAAI